MLAQELKPLAVTNLHIWLANLVSGMPGDREAVLKTGYQYWRLKPDIHSWLPQMIPSAIVALTKIDVFVFVVW